MKILLADSSESSRRAQRPVLASIAAQVVECQGGEDAIARARSENPDLLIVADRLADMDGLAVVREFKRIAPSTRALVLGQNGSPARVIEAIRAGADNFVTIPWTPDLLHQRITETLARAARLNA